MKKTTILMILSIAFLVVPSMALADGSATVSWQANTETDLAGYRIYYGTEPGVYGSTSALITGTTYTITGLQEGKIYYFVVTAVDTAGNESGYSAPEVSKTIPASGGAGLSSVSTAGKGADSSSGGVTTLSSKDIIPIQLPAIGEYGLVAGIAMNQENEVHFSFNGLAGAVTIRYDAYDIDENEVRIYINGRAVGYVPVGQGGTWSDDQTVILPDVNVNDFEINIISFYNTQNPPNMWGVRDLKID